MHFVPMCIAAVKKAVAAAVIVHCRGDSWICDQSEWYWQHQSASPSYQHTRAKTNNRTTSKILHQILYQIVRRITVA